MRRHVVDRDFIGRNLRRAALLSFDERRAEPLALARDRGERPVLRQDGEAAVLIGDADAPNQRGGKARISRRHARGLDRHWIALLGLTVRLFHRAKRLKAIPNLGHALA